MKTLQWLLCGFLCLVACHVGAQEPKKPLRINLNQAGSQYLDLSSTLQIWLRYARLNPGSITRGDLSPQDIGDISLRRIRLGMSGLVQKNVFVTLGLGLNNLNYLSDRSVSMQVLDAYAEYRYHDWLHIGIGKTAWGGISRYSAPSATSSLGYDISILPLPTLDITDALLRRLALFFKGQIHRLDYRVSVIKPLAIQGGGPLSDDLEEGVAQFADLSFDTSWGATSYFKWFFAEKESNDTAFSPGTYLHRKRVMNLGFGIEFQKDRTASLSNGEVIFHNLNLLAADYFLNLPTKRRQAWTLYGAYFFYDFGPNLIRNVGVNNPVIGLDEERASFNGAGVAYPVHGTGHSYYARSGYYWGYQEKKGVLPYFDMQVSDFDRLHDLMMVWNVGLSWLLQEHRSKLSINYQNRPIFREREGQVRRSGRKGQVVLQYQLVVP